MGLGTKWPKYVTAISSSSSTPFLYQEILLEHLRQLLVDPLLEDSQWRKVVSMGGWKCQKEWSADYQLHQHPKGSWPTPNCILNLIYYKERMGQRCLTHQPEIRWEVFWPFHIWVDFNFHNAGTVNQEQVGKGNISAATVGFQASKKSEEQMDRLLASHHEKLPWLRKCNQNGDLTGVNCLQWWANPPQLNSELST